MLTHLIKVAIFVGNIFQFVVNVEVVARVDGVNFFLLSISGAGCTTSAARLRPYATSAAAMPSVASNAFLCHSPLAAANFVELNVTIVINGWHLECLVVVMIIVIVTSVSLLSS